MFKEKGPYSSSVCVAKVCDAAELEHEIEKPKKVSCVGYGIQLTRLNTFDIAVKTDVNSDDVTSTRMT